MRAMILAAGRGERMGELTSATPKPLLKIAGHYLIEYAIASLKHAGIVDIVINVCYLKEQIKAALGDGGAFGVNILYSEEHERLETGGGIVKALPLLGADPFVVISCDIVTDFPMVTLPTQLSGLAHLVLVENPAYHVQGDFGLRGQHVTLESTTKKTYANLGVYHPDLFVNCKLEHFRLTNVLLPAISANQVTGEYYSGRWYNVGSAQELQYTNQHIQADSNLLV